MHLSLSAGANATLTGTAPYTVVVTHRNGPEISLTAFALDESERVRSERDMVFYNQNLCASEGIEWVAPRSNALLTSHELRINPHKWTNGIERVRIGITLDDGSQFSQVEDLKATIVDVNEQIIAEFNLSSRDEQNAFIVADIYRRNGQLKAKCQAAGFVNGLAGLARDVGVEIDDEPQPVVEAPAALRREAPPAPTNFVKKLADATLPTTALPVDFRKQKLAVVLVKNNLDGKIYRVVLLIDASGSMDRLFSEGGWGRSKQPSVVQRSLERMVPVADLLDDNSEMEVWYFGTCPSRSDSVTIESMEGYIGRTKHQKNAAGRSNNEVAAMTDVLNWVEQNPSEHPTLVLAWSDGGVYDRDGIKQFFVDTNDKNIVWVWLGLGGNVSSYGVLAEFDEDNDGRPIDNVGFVHIDDIEKMTDEDLYGKIFKHVSDWHRSVTAAGIAS